MSEIPSQKIIRSGSLSRKPSGFTLIEILIALAIVMILSAISIPFYQGYIGKAKVTLGISTLETVRKTLDGYQIDYNRYPPAIDLATGEDGEGKVVLPPSLLAEFKINLHSMESYAVTASDYTLTALATDSNHTVLVLTPGQVIAKGP